MKKILIIDDEEEVREELRDRLSSMGYESEQASCQEEAKRMFGEVDYDLVILDLGIPVKFEGVARVDHGRNLLEHFVAKPGAPPVIVITANGLDGHKLAVEMMDLGAATFVGKPFTSDPIEPKVKIWIESKPVRARCGELSKEPFKGGVLTLHEDSIELCDEIVGGTRGNGYIRKIVGILMVKKDGRYPKLSGVQLAKAIGGNIGAPAMASAIKEFRDLCCQKLGCGPNDVIETGQGGGYRIAEAIDAKLGREEGPLAQIDEDKEFIVRQLKRHGTRTRKQLADVGGIPVARVRLALQSLGEDGAIHCGSGANYSLELLR